MILTSLHPQKYYALLGGRFTSSSCFRVTAAQGFQELGPIHTIHEYHKAHPRGAREAFSHTHTLRFIDFDYISGLK